MGLCVDLRTIRVDGWPMDDHKSYPHTLINHLQNRGCAAVYAYSYLVTMLASGYRPTLEELQELLSAMDREDPSLAPDHDHTLAKLRP